MSLGAAGCKYTEKDAFCMHHEMRGEEHYCGKYNMPLIIMPKVWEPIRLKICGDDAHKEIESKLAMARRMKG